MTRRKKPARFSAIRSPECRDELRAEIDKSVRHLQPAQAQVRRVLGGIALQPLRQQGLSGSLLLAQEASQEVSSAEDLDALSEAPIRNSSHVCRAGHAVPRAVRRRSHRRETPRTAEGPAVRRLIW